MTQKYRHLVALNPQHVVLNHRLFDICPKQVSPELLAGILNSTIVALSKLQFGRSNLGEATLETEVIDVESMMVPDAREASEETAAKILGAVGKLKKRASLHLIEELKLEDRRWLDDSVLELLGTTTSNEREALLSELYSELTGFYRQARELDLKAQADRRTTARRGRASPHTIAEEIWGEFDTANLRGSPVAFIPQGELIDPVMLPAGKPKVLEDLFDRGAVQINSHVVKLGSRAKAEFAAKIAELGLYGEVAIPRNDRVCEKALDSYRRYEAQMEVKFRELAEERSADPEIQARIVRELWKLFFAAMRHAHL